MWLSSLHRLQRKVENTLSRNEISKTLLHPVQEVQCLSSTYSARCNAAGLGYGQQTERQKQMKSLVLEALWEEEGGWGEAVKSAGEGS